MSDDNTVHNKALGSRLKLLRKARGLTQEELAIKCSLAADTVRRAEAGEFAPSYTTLRKMATGLAVPVAALFSDDYDQAADLATQLRAMDEREFRLIVALAKVLDEYAAEERRKGRR